jgi:hypothetical protein
MIYKTENRNMSTLRYAALAMALVMTLASCSRKATPVPIEGLELRKDEVRKFEIKVPKNWFVQQRRGDLVLAISSKTHSSRFLSFGKGKGGAKIELRAFPLDSATTIDSLVKRSKLEFEDNLDRYERSVATLGGKPAQKLAVKFDQEDGEYRSEIYFAENDSVITIVTLAAFGNTFGDYEKEFAEVLSSVKLAQRPVIAAPTPSGPAAPEPPSDTLRNYNAPDFTIQIPQNFQGTKGQASGLSSMSFAGSRLDCTIQVDVFDAKDQKNLDKIIEQNKGKYGGGSATATSLSGVKAYYFTYNPAANIQSRAYFMVKGDRMVRVTMNWFKPEQAIYLPIFEKSLATFKLK